MSLEQPRDTRGRFRRESDDERFARFNRIARSGMIMQLYVGAEMAKADFARGTRELNRESPFDPLVTNRFTYDNSQALAVLHDMAIQAGERVIFKSTQDDSEIHALKKSGLAAAKKWWEKRLADTDNITADEIMLGRRRITQLSEELEKLEETQPT